MMGNQVNENIHYLGLQFDGGSVSADLARCLLKNPATDQKLG